MSDRMYLIQTGHINKIEKGEVCSRSTVLSLDYMGSAEFEFGAYQRSQKILHEAYLKGDITLKDTDLRSVDKRHLYLLTRSEEWDRALEEIKIYLDNISHVDKIMTYYTKEPTHFDEVMDKWHYDHVINPRYRTNVNFWMDIEHDWMFFLATKEQLKNFKRAFFSAWKLPIKEDK